VTDQDPQGPRSSGRTAPRPISRRQRSRAMIGGPIMPDKLPIIDLGGSGESDGASLNRIVADVGAACRHAGFFYVVNHGVEAALIAEAFTQSHRFFGLLRPWCPARPSASS
jgi:hypothetical protein